MAGGRPTVMTPEVVLKLEYAFSCGCTDVQACLFAGISRQSFYKWIDEENPSFSDRKETLKQNVQLHAKMNIAKNVIQDKSLATSQYVLDKTEYSKFAPTVQINQHNQTLNLVKLTPEEAYMKMLQGEDATKLIEQRKDHETTVESNT